MTKINNYYFDKINFLEEIFGTHNIKLNDQSIVINNIKYPIIDDVIIMHKNLVDEKKISTIKSFGNEWIEFNEITSEHFDEFNLYFDLVDLNKLKNKKIIDIGCGIGRWSKILIDKINIDKLVLLDLSDSIFIARKFFRENNNVIFIQQDLEKIQFKKNSFDFLACLGVLHHLPNREKNIINELSNISNYSLFYLYYKLDDMSKGFKFIFFFADIIRRILSKSNNEKINILVSYFITIIFYLPFVIIAKFLKKIGLQNSRFPLSFYENASFFRIRQDAYDRFFTNIEFRTSKEEIHKIYGKYFNKITISKIKPYWHFICERYL